MLEWMLNGRKRNKSVNNKVGIKCREVNMIRY